ncbi:MAG TPA: NADH-quinone oxidoreductase subunit J [Candidatus Thermoplasmatota archaeon]|nr:NADH-quinone oxidoreductase subunit J [Candidatus Thermoplasmatota archaeon]
MTSLGETISFAAIAAVILGTALASVLSKRTFHSVMFLGAVLVAMGALFILLGSSLVGIIQVLVYVGGILTLFIFAVMFVTGDEEETETMPSKLPMAPWLKVIAAILAIGGGFWLFLRFVVPTVWVLVQAALLTVLGAFSLKALVLLVVLLVAFALAVAVVIGIAVLGYYVAARLLTNLVYGKGAQRVAGLVPIVLYLVMTAVVASTTPWLDGDAAAAPTDANDLTAVTDALFGPDVIAFEVLGVLLTAVMIGALVIARPLDAQSDAERYSCPTREQVAESDHASNVKESLGRTAAANDPMTTRFSAEELPE